MMTRKLLATFVITAGCALLLGSQPVLAQKSNQDLRKEIEALKKGQETILKELQDIKQMLQSRPGEPAAGEASLTIDIGQRPVLGSAGASLILIEFSDFQCPFCTRYHAQVLPQIDTEYVKTGKLRRTFFDFPLEEMHALAFKAAIAGRCAGDQGKFFEMQERLFANFRTLEPLADHAKAVGLDETTFNACLNSTKYNDAVRKDVSQGRMLGIEGTPHFIIARIDPTNPTRVAIVGRINGARPFDSFKQEIDKALAPPAK